jgi:Cu(I)/Ag(I) efflux system membrane fusion protein
MTKIKAAGIVLSAVVIMFSYFISPHISISWLAVNTAPPKVAATAEPKTSSLPSINPAEQGKVWVCPMHPEIMQDHPGTCPICGMDLVESKSNTAHDHGIHVDNATIQNLGVRLARVKRSAITDEVRTYGNVTADERTLYNIHSFFEGVIRKSYIHSIGQKIQKGQVIYEIYSPELIMQQKDYLKFVTRRNQILQSITGDSLIYENEYVMDLLEELSRERTKFLYEDIGFETVQQIEDHKRVIDVVPILAAESGTVTQISAREGDNVMPAVTLFALADVNRVWVTATLYPDQAGQVQAGDEAVIASPGKPSVKTRLAFLSPVADSNKVIARMEIDNSELHLRPGSFVDVSIHAQSHQALVVPSSAVLRTGEVNVVMLHRGEGHFLPVYVDTGIENGDLIEITDGLQPGAEVAVNGQFLLDSAASMNAAAERMQSHEHTASETHDAKPESHDAR